MAEYDFRCVELDEPALAAVAALFHIVWPDAKHLTQDYLRWLYADNPSGQVLGFNAWSGSTLAGHYVVIPIRAAFHGAPVRAALSLNTAVHPGHQGKGLFTKLAQATYELAAGRGVHHVIGVANANSTPGFLRKLEFQLICPLDARIQWRWPQAAPAGARPSLSWVRVWEPDDLLWRVRNPAVRYRVAIRHGCRYLLAPTGKYGIQAILKTEALSAAADLSAAHLARVPRAGGKLWLGRSRGVTFPALGGMRLPDRLRASPLNLIIRYLTPGSQPVTSETVEFEAIDFDAY